MLTTLWKDKPKTVLLVWLFSSLILGILGLQIGMHTVVPGPSSKEAIERYPGESIAIDAGIAPKDSLLLIVTSTKYNTSEEEFIEARESLVQLLRSQKIDGSVLFPRVRTSGHTLLFEDDDFYSSANQHALLIRAESDFALFESAKHFKTIPPVINTWSRDYQNFNVNYISEGTGDNEIFELINRDLDNSLIYTIPITLLILLLTFRSFVVALTPLIVALVSLVSSLGLSAILSHFYHSVSVTAAQLVVLLVLALGVDYSLFMVSRVREECRAGLGYIEAVTKVRASTGLAIFWSGITVTCSLFGLFLMKDSILTSMAFVSIISVFITLIGSILVLPSLLLLMKRFVVVPSDSKANRLNFPWVELSLKHPVLALVLTLALMLALSFPLKMIVLGSTMEREVLPKTMQSSEAFQVLTQNFPDLSGTSFSVVLQSPVLQDLEESGGLQPFFNLIQAENNVLGPINPNFSEDSTVARFDFIASGNSNLKANQELVHKIRTNYSSATLEPLGVSSYVSGNLAFVTDESERYVHRTFLVICVVLALSFVFLLVAFRSVVVPLKALILNCLSCASAFGILVLLFQGEASWLWNYGVIESFVPALLFSILFGLSMDYHVLLLSRIQEEVKKGGDTVSSVALGIKSTSRTITSAAAIMASVFIIIASLELPVMKQLGLGLALAVLFDATLIRCIVLPASMVLLGRLNWYLPKSLTWIPRIKLD